MPAFEVALTITPTATGQTSETTGLNRHAAGLLGYFKNIPEKADGKRVPALLVRLVDDDDIITMTIYPGGEEAAGGRRR